MFFATNIKDCCETVIAAMAYQIDQLQYELQYKQSRIDALERENEKLRTELEAKAAERSGTLGEIVEEARARFAEILQQPNVQP